GSRRQIRPNPDDPFTDLCEHAIRIGSIPDDLGEPVRRLPGRAWALPHTRANNRLAGRVPATLGLRKESVMKHRYAVAALVLMIALSVIVDVPRSAEAGAPPVLRDDDDYEPPTLEQQKVLQMNDQKNKLVAWQCFNYLSKASWAPQQLIQLASDQCDKVW